MVVALVYYYRPRRIKPKMFQNGLFIATVLGIPREYLHYARIERGSKEKSGKAWAQTSRVR